MKLFVSYKEGEDEGHHMATKFTVPKGWRPGPIAKVLAFSVETYNSKHPENVLKVEEVHFEKEGEKLGLEDIVEAVLQTKDEVLIVPGASAALGDAAQARADAEKKAAEEKEAARIFAIGKVKCRNFGCNMLFDPLDNPEGGCHHHTGPPFFHDCNKGWTCCRGKTAMDWEDFQKLPTCAVGKHSAEPPKAPEKKCEPCDDKFVAQKVVTKSIDGYNKSDEGKNAKTAAQGFAKSTGTKAKPKVVKYDDGSFRCQNKGCQAKFHPDDNGPTACSYHSGTPVFHETLKWWGCCPHKKKMDFDEFMLVPGCCKGYHWNGEGDPPAPTTCSSAPPVTAMDCEDGADVVEAGDEGFDLG